MNKLSAIQATGKVVKEAVPRHFELMEYIGTDEIGEAVRFYVYRIEKIVEIKNNSIEPNVKHKIP
ncbi:hypothetical protein [Sphingobacterium sp. DR205]|uniref:hypothetical protein n=1 Tax=Sphingobacterium sp. DR205 TaxID=2713573 RepID=UPI0013E4E943|nr:hypothetical protein [Sphingobacterium sp. DR205]QIH35929.1 hypothetical protein G6053_24980 [Sphingobacterium sp. DR205]